MAELDKSRLLNAVREYGAASRKLGATSFFKPEWKQAEQAATDAFNTVLAELYPSMRSYLGVGPTDEDLERSTNRMLEAAGLEPMERASRELDGMGDDDAQDNAT